MKLRTLLLIMAVILSAATLGLAADYTFTGTWKLNETKSKIPTGAAKNNTVIYETVGDNVKLTINGTDGQGSPTRNERTGKFDGKDYPVTGDPNSDTRSAKKINERTLAITVK